MIAPVFQVVGHRHAIDRGGCRTGAHAPKYSMKRPEDEDPRRTVTLPDIEGELAFEHVSFAYETREASVAGRELSWRCRAR